MADIEEKLPECEKCECEVDELCAECNLCIDCCSCAEGFAVIEDAEGAELDDECDDDEEEGDEEEEEEGE